MPVDSRRSSGSYSYYTFPPTPNRDVPSPTGSYKSSSAAAPAAQKPSQTVSETPGPPTHQSSKSQSTPRFRPPPAMAPKSATKLPSTPTRAGRNPASSTTPKLSQSTQKPQGSANKLGQKAGQNVSQKANEAKDSTTSPKLSQRPKQVDQAAEKAKDTVSEAEKAKDTASEAEKPVRDAKDQAEEATGDVQQKIGLKDNEGDADDEEDTDVPRGKVSQRPGEEESTDDLQELDPTPEQNGDDAVSDAKDTAQQTAGGAVGGAKGLAGKATGAASKLGSGAKDTAGNVASQAQDTAGNVKDTAEGTVKKAGKGDVQGAAGEVGDGAKDTAKGTVKNTKKTADGVKDSAEDAVDDATEGVKEVAPEQAGEAVGGAKDTAEEAVDQAQDTTEGAVDQAQDTAEGAVDTAGEAAEGAVGKAKDTAEDAADQLPLDLSILKGLKLGQDGNVFSEEGDQIGQLQEGEISDLAGRAIGDDGEILDEDGDVIGRVGLTDEGKEFAQQKVQETGDQAGEVADQAEETAEDVGDKAGEAADQAEEAVDQAEETAEDVGDEAENAAEEAETYLPDLSILKGLKVQEDGDIYDNDGNLVGRITEGDPSYLVDQELNEEGEVLDEDGDAIGRADVLPQPVQQAQEEAEEQVDDAAEGAEEAGEEAAGGELPTEIVPDLSILQSRKINKKGRILDDEGEPIGQLSDDSDLKQCIGKIPNENGEVLNDKGEVVGRVHVVEGQAAEELMKELHPDLAEQVEQAKENAEDAADEAEDAAEEAEQALPDFSVVEGYKVNKKGMVLNEDGEELAKLAEGDPTQCAGKKVNENGEVLDKEGEVIGKVELVGAAAEQAQDQTPDISELEGYKVNKKGQVLDEDGEPIAKLAEGEISDAAGMKINDKGEVIGKDGSVIGKVEYLKPEQPEGEEGEGEGETGEEADNEQQEAQEEDGPQLPDISTLEGLKCNKQGFIVDSNGNQVGKLTEGDAKKISKAGLQLDDQGQFWDSRGRVIGKAEALPVEDEDEEGPFAGLEGLIVAKGGFVEDENGNRVGKLVEGDEKKLVGRAVDEDGDILDKKGNTVGRAERWEEEEEEEEPEPEKPDLSALANLQLNKQGNLIGPDGVPIGRLVEGNAKELAGRKCDGEGQIWNDSGKVVGRCELIPENEREAKAEGPFAGLEGLHVVKGGWVEDEEGNRVGQIVDGDAKRLIGRQVDADGDVVDRYGNVKGHAEPYDEPEEEEEDLSSLEGKKVNKAGNVVDEHGTIFGRIASGDPKKLAGRKVDGQGQIWSDNGKVIGQAELVPGGEQESKPEGPFSAWDTLSINKEGHVVTPEGSIVGRVVEGDVKKLEGRHPDDDGDVLDRNGNTIGKVERWEPEQKERKVSPMSGRKVNKKGEVVSEDGDVVGKLTMGDLGRCIGCEIDDNANVLDSDGNKIGECTLLENIQEEEEEEEVEDEGPSEEELKAQHDAELAKKMNGIVQQTIDRMEPLCKEITDHIERADRTPKDELDEDDLVNKVKPLIEEGGRNLQECNGALRGLDPDGSIAAKAKANAAGRDATPEEYALADSLKELTTNVVKTVDNAKKRISDMPHAKKKLNPLWGLLTEPLFQIIAAVGLLLAGVLGLVGRLLNGLGLGGLVNGLLGGLGIDKLLGGLGLGSITESLGMGGGDKKSK